jgi:hypothetical protein
MNLFRKVFAAIRSVSFFPQHSQRSFFRKPFLETLEDRVVLTSYLWEGANGGLWSNGNNWKQLDSATPGKLGFVGGQLKTGDTLVFRGATDTTSTDDIDTKAKGLVLALNISTGGIPGIPGVPAAAYTKTITVDKNIPLQLDTGSILATSATLSLAGGAKIIVDGTVQWSSGKIVGGLVEVKASGKLLYSLLNVPGA